MGKNIQFRHSGACRYVGPRNLGAMRVSLRNTTCCYNKALDPGLRRDDVVAGNRELLEGHWLVYCVFRSDAGKDVSTGLNITHANQPLNYLFRSISPTNFSDEPK